MGDVVWAEGYWAYPVLSEVWMLWLTASRPSAGSPPISRTSNEWDKGKAKHLVLGRHEDLAEDSVMDELQLQTGD